MNVTDLYWNIKNALYPGLNISVDTESRILFGFLPCDKDYIHITLPETIVTDIQNNNTQYIKCLYCDNYNYSRNVLKNTLSVFTRMQCYDSQIIMRKIFMKDDIYYVGSGLILDNDKNILVSICRADAVDNKLVISPKVFIEKTTMNKYITSKLIPECAKHSMEIDIKPRTFHFIRSGDMSKATDILNNNDIMSNDYRFCKEVEY